MNTLKQNTIKRYEELFTYLRLLLHRSNLPKKRFIIFAQTRTGSYLLQDLLNSHPEVYCDGEILWNFSKSMVKNIVFPYLYIDGKSRYRKNLNVYGCHIKINQILEYTNYLYFLSKLHERGWQIIYIKRLNILRQSISEVIAKNTNIWIAKQGQEYSINKNYIDCDRLIKTLDIHKYFGDKEQAALERLPHLKIVYEDDLLNPDKHQDTLNKIFNYLGIKSVPVKTNLIKISAESMSSFIKNYDEVRENIEKTEYRELLNYR